MFSSLHGFNLLKFYICTSFTGVILQGDLQRTKMFFFGEKKHIKLQLKDMAVFSFVPESFFYTMWTHLSRLSIFAEV